MKFQIVTGCLLLAVQVFVRVPDSEAKINYAACRACCYMVEGEKPAFYPFCGKGCEKSNQCAKNNPNLSLLDRALEGCEAGEDLINYGNFTLKGHRDTNARVLTTEVKGDRTFYCQQNGEEEGVLFDEVPSVSIPTCQYCCAALSSRLDDETEMGYDASRCKEFGCTNKCKLSEVLETDGGCKIGESFVLHGVVTIYGTNFSCVTGNDEQGFLLPHAPTSSPTMSPTIPSPTSSPSSSPTTSDPTSAPTFKPTAFPSERPTESPTISSPTFSPSSSPTTSAPSSAPTFKPTVLPSESPTESPTTSLPTLFPSFSPITSAPTAAPTFKPSVAPVTSAPTTSEPTSFPTRPTIGKARTQANNVGQDKSNSMSSGAVATIVILVLLSVAAICAFVYLKKGRVFKKSSETNDAQDPNMDVLSETETKQTRDVTVL